MLSACSISIARTIWRSLAARLRSLRGSSSRATCMVSVEPPERILPAGDELQRGARERQRVDAVMASGSACPHRRTASSKKRGSTSATRAGKPPAALACRVGAQQPAVAISDAGREADVLAQRRRAERRDPPAAGAESARQNTLATSKITRKRERDCCPLVPAKAGTQFATIPSPRLDSRFRATSAMTGIWTRSFRRRHFHTSRSRCGRSGRDGTCPRPSPAGAHIFRAPPRARHRRR